MCRLHDGVATAYPVQQDARRQIETLKDILKLASQCSMEELNDNVSVIMAPTEVAQIGAQIGY